MILVPNVAPFTWEWLILYDERNEFMEPGADARAFGTNPTRDAAWGDQSTIPASRRSLFRTRAASQ